MLMLSSVSTLLAQSASVNVDSNSSSAGMNIISWLVLGLVAGFIASKLVNKTGEGIVLDIVLGIVGAFIGGFIVRSIGIGPGVSGLNIASLLVAVLGAVVLLVVYHAVRGGSRSAR